LFEEQMMNLFEEQTMTVFECTCSVPCIEWLTLTYNASFKRWSINREIDGTTSCSIEIETITAVIWRSRSGAVIKWWIINWYLIFSSTNKKGTTMTSVFWKSGEICFFNCDCVTWVRLSVLRSCFIF
jgi:hypothetical protein